MKNPLNSFINVFGLAVAIGICIFAYAFAQWSYSTDQFHENKNTVYLVTFFANRDGKEQQYGKAPRPLGEMMQVDFAQIKRLCRIEDRNVVMKQNDNVFHERVRFTDPEFLQMFTFPLKWGVSGSLADVNSIILSETMSVKYFGDENPIGQNILIKFDKDRSKVFKVTGVASGFPKSLTIAFDFLINFENLRNSDPGYDFHDWKSLVNATLIQVNNLQDLKAIERGMEKYKKLQNEAAQEDWAITSFAFEPLATLHERSEFIKDDISRSSGSNYKSIIYMAIVGAFLLVLACFNYINISITSAAKRLKEIGVRKSIGATRRTVIVQFLSENIVITLFAMILGLILGMTVFIPGFEHLWVSLDMNFKLTDPRLWIYLSVILLFTSIASGIYPSLYISKFQVAGILKGSVKFGKKNPLTKVFLGFQLVLACIFITSAVMFTQNSLYLAHRPWGYNQDETLYAVVPDPMSFEQLNAVMARDPDVLSISGSVHHLGKVHATTILHFPDREVEADQLEVDARYFGTMGLQLASGRFFNDHEGSDRQAVIVNDLLAENMKWEHPIGQTFTIDTLSYEVIGVLKEFHSFSFFKPVKPTIFKVADRKDYRYLSLQVRSGSEQKVYTDLQKQWAGLFPEIPFEGGHQEDVWGFYYEELRIHGLVWQIFAFLAVTLASLGLYGLITLNVAGRIREFSIRKVLGAGARSIASNIYNPYLILFGVALTFGAPLGYVMVKNLLILAYAYHKPADFSGAVIAVIVLVLVLVITVFTQLRKVVNENPVNGLKVE